LIVVKNLHLHKSLSIPTPGAHVKPYTLRNNPKINKELTVSDLEPIPPTEAVPPPTTAGKFSDPAYLFVGADGLRAGWGMLIFIVLFAVLGLATSFLSARIQHKPFPPKPQAASAPAASKEEPPRRTILNEGISFLIVLVVAFILSKIERRPNSRYGFGGTHRIPQFLQGLGWGLVCLSFLVATLYFAGYLHFDGRLLSNAAGFKYGLVWAVGFTLVGCLEESLTRGYLQYTLARGLAGIYGALFNTRHRHALGFWTAAVVFSFLFGLGHSNNPGESPFGLVSAGLAGLVFCLALYRTGSLWWAIGFHASWDWAQSFLYGVADSGTMVRGHLYATHPTGAPILSGGLTGPEGSILLIPALALAVAAIVFTLPKTHHPGEGLSHPDTP
jgi:membrane protease YdiL (CAAX protease family)